jgi:CheY-like chemotaxis protein
MMLSSAARREDAIRSRELGVAAYLTKPVGQRELRETLANVLARTASRALPQRASQPVPQMPSESLHVLLAEDNEVNQRLTTVLLQKHGHRVTLAKDGAEAVSCFERQQFDIILMDIQMPVMDGFEATAQIRAKELRTGDRTPVIALTAHAMPEDRARCLQAGFDEYMSKPIRIQALLGAIQKIHRKPAEVPA